MASVIVRPFLHADIEFAVACCAREGWTTSLSWFEVLLALDPAGSVIAEMDGAPAAMITTARYADTAWIGNLIVLPEYRRAGLGSRLMAVVLDYVSSAGIATVRLDADPPGMNIYRRLGFVEEFESLRFRRAPGDARPTSSSAPLTSLDLDAVAACDRLAFGDDRSALIRALVEHAHAALVARRSGAVAGYLLVTPSTTGLHIGPCVADGAETARDLLSGALDRAAGRAVTVGVPGPNTAAAELLQSLGFSATAPSVRMVKGPRAGAGMPERVFAIANGAVG